MTIWIFFLAFAVRASALLLHLPLEDPSWSPHWNLATGILKYGTLGFQGERITWMEPGYPFFLAAARYFSLNLITPVFFWQSAAASLGACFLYLLVLTVTQKKFCAMAAACLYILYPYYIGQSIEVIEVPVITTLLIASAYFWQRAFQVPSLFNVFLCALAFSLTVLTRSMTLPALLIATGIFLSLKRRKVFFSLLFSFALLCAPWMARNLSVDGSLVPPRSGWNLLQANCPYTAQILPNYNPDLLDAYVSQLLEEKRPDLANAPDRETLGREVDDFFTAEAHRYIRQHPIKFIKQRILNLFYFFHPKLVPYLGMNGKTRIIFEDGETARVENAVRRSPVKELSHSLFYGIIFLFGIYGMFVRRKQWRGDLILYAYLITFAAIYSLYWPAARLRAPIDFVFMYYTAAALASMPFFSKFCR